MPLIRPARACAGTADDRRWHAVHGNGIRCTVCWPDQVGVRVPKEHTGLPPMPKSTAVYPGSEPAEDWRAEMLRAEFGDDIPDELAA